MLFGCQLGDGGCFDDLVGMLDKLVDVLADDVGCHVARLDGLVDVLGGVVAYMVGRVA